MKQTVAILGLGTMGMGMGSNLLAAGFTVRAYNRTQSKTELLANSGATACTTPAEAAQNADIIVSMLANDEASREAWIGPQGALAAAQAGAVLVEASTLSPSWVEELAGAAALRGLTLLDAPVTGSRTQAEGGQLNFLVGGEAAALSIARPALEAMGQSVTHLGPVGSGARLKLINNFLCGVQVASLAEAIAWMEGSGLDRDQALEVLKKGAPGSPLLKAISDRMVERTYEVNFLLPLMDKDMRYAQADALRFEVDLRTSTAAESRFDDAVRAGLTDKDMSAVVEPLRRGRA